VPSLRGVLNADRRQAGLERLVIEFEFNGSKSMRFSKQTHLA
jgi:hypothetical protein